MIIHKYLYTFMRLWDKFFFCAKKTVHSFIAGQQMIKPTHSRIMDDAMAISIKILFPHACLCNIFLMSCFTDGLVIIFVRECRSIDASSVLLNCVFFFSFHEKYRVQCAYFRWVNFQQWIITHASIGRRIFLYKTTVNHIKEKTFKVCGM